MNNANPEHLEKSLEPLHQQVSNYNSLHPDQPKLAFSHGTAQFDPAKPEELETLIQRADTRMYREKASKTSR